jgi:hypothetical protein
MFQSPTRPETSTAFLSRHNEEAETSAVDTSSIRAIAATEAKIAR